MPSQLLHPLGPYALDPYDEHADDESHEASGCRVGCCLGEEGGIKPLVVLIQYVAKPLKGLKGLTGEL